MFINPIIGMIHNTKDGTFHPVVFTEYALPGGVDAPTRHKSKAHHTTGFGARDEAVAYARGELAKAVRLADADRTPRFALAKDFAWDGKGIPAMVEFFTEGTDGEMVPALA